MTSWGGRREEGGGGGQTKGRCEGRMRDAMRLRHVLTDYLDSRVMGLVVVVVVVLFCFSFFLVFFFFFLLMVV